MNAQITMNTQNHFLSKALANACMRETPFFLKIENEAAQKRILRVASFEGFLLNSATRVRGSLEKFFPGIQSHAGYRELFLIKS